MIFVIVPSDLQMYFPKKRVKKELELANDHELALGCFRLPQKVARQME